MREQLHRLEGLSGAAGGDGRKRQRLGAFVAEAQFLEGVVGGASQFSCFAVQIQLEIKFGKIQIAQSQLIRVGGLLRADRSLAQHLDGAPEFTAQKIQVRDVVVGIRDQDRHAFLLTVLASLAMEIESLGEIVQADAAEREVAERSGNALRVVMLDQFLVGTLVEFHCLGKAVLPVIDISDIDFQPRQPSDVALFLEDRSRTFARRECVVVAPQQEQRLDRSAQRACQFGLISRLLEQCDRLLVQLDRRGVVVERIQGVGLGAQTLCQRGLVARGFGGFDGDVGNPLRLNGVDADLLPHALCQVRDDLDPVGS